MTCVSGPLTLTQLLEEVPEIVKLLQSSGIEQLVIEYGWGCKLEPERLWQDIEVRALDLVTFIQDSIDKGIYPAGQADMVLRDRDGNFELLFCRDSDIHLMTDDDVILAEATKRWMDKGYGGFKLAAHEDWEPI